MTVFVFALMMISFVDGVSVTRRTTTLGGVSSSKQPVWRHFCVYVCCLLSSLYIYTHTHTHTPSNARFVVLSSCEDELKAFCVWSFFFPSRTLNENFSSEIPSFLAPFVLLLLLLMTKKKVFLSSIYSSKERDTFPPQTHHHTSNKHTFTVIIILLRFFYTYNLFYSFFLQRLIIIIIIIIHH